MADTEIRFPGIPSGLTVTTRVRDPESLAILETVALSETGNYYTGDVSGSHAGQFVFEVLISGTVAEARVRTISDDDGPYVIQPHLENLDVLAAIKSRTDMIGSVTFLVEGSAVSSNGELVIKSGDRHQFTITSETEDAVPDLTGVTIRFGIKGNGGAQLLETTNVTVNEATGFQSITVLLTPEETIELNQGAAHFDVQAEYDTDDHRTFLTGSVQIKPDYSGVP